MDKLSKYFRQLSDRLSGPYGAMLLVPLLVIMAFCFGYTEYRMHSEQHTPASAPITPELSQSQATEDIPLADQSKLQPVTITPTSSDTGETLSNDTQSTQTQVPSPSASSNPQSDTRTRGLLQDTISQEQYISLLRKDL